MVNSLCSTSEELRHQRGRASLRSTANGSKVRFSKWKSKGEVSAEKMCVRTFTLHEVRKNPGQRKEVVSQECVCVSKKEDGAFEVIVI